MAMCTGGRSAISPTSIAEFIRCTQGSVFAAAGTRSQVPEHIHSGRAAMPGVKSMAIALTIVSSIREFARMAYERRVGVLGGICNPEAILVDLKRANLRFQGRA